MRIVAGAPGAAEHVPLQHHAAAAVIDHRNWGGVIGSHACSMPYSSTIENLRAENPAQITAPVRDRVHRQTRRAPRSPSEAAAKRRARSNLPFRYTPRKAARRPG